MVYARLQVRFPESLWIGRLSRMYPSATVTALSALGVDDDVVTLVSVTGAPPAEIVELARSDPAVTEFDTVARTADRLVFSYRTRSTIYRAAERSGVPPVYPIEVQDGWADIECNTSRSALSAFVTELESEGGVVEVTALSDGSNGNALLTRRQREMLTAAYDRGYYDSPRRCSTADLAELFDVAPSTVSDVLRRAERRALGSVLAETASRDHSA
ncbi:helix-turn-helix domain-containing protein [Salinirubrum litoreum]|uniref:Helix-turn-helix domain-containing protein n=1 Tax=Salinirubrum litoreum TaxID=1126234 RepID=A0ABD5RB91_9EURY|nr:helix-turn-helix domain-containing protein [Salinirubrum litoreum]